MSKQDNKLRVYEYAKSLNMSSKEIITILKRMDVPVNNHMSVMEPEAVEKVEQFFKDLKESAAAKRAENEAKQNTAPAPSAKPAAPQSGRPQGGNARHDDRRGGRTGERHPGNRQGQNRPQRTDSGRNNAGNGGGGAGRTGGGGAPRSGGGDRGKPQSPAAHSGNRQGGSSRQDNTAVKTSNAPAAKRDQRGTAEGKPDNRQVSRRGQERDRFSDNSESKGKTTKKNKANGKRFDDNRVSDMRGSRSRSGRGGKRGRQQQDFVRKEKIDNTPKKIIVRGEMTVGDLAKILHKDVADVIKKLMFIGVMATINKELDLDSIQLLAQDYGVEVELKLPVEVDPFEMEEEQEDENKLAERPPVVTIMGHVDHGKTTLLDAIRHTRVTDDEAGGITQHIGAYQVEIKNRKITFLDTPGHEAFTTMRARGASVTDITILVVAADDGVMPQTVEAINHAKAANVPIIVAVNKIDKEEANPDRVKQELTEHELVPEEWGGDTIFVNVSAKQRTGLEDLLEMILLVAEVQEYKANPERFARGTVIEAELDKGRGPVARVLVQQGTLRIGDPLVAGVCFGRVRAMMNDKGRRIKDASPSTPVEITGLNEVPLAGDPFIVFEDERLAREIADRRSITLRQSELKANSKVTLDDLYKQIQEGEIKDLNVIIKGDVQGSVEALKGSLEKIDIEGVRVKIIHTGAGAITESDIILASASNAIVIGFNVRPEPAARTTAEHENVDIRLHRVIYNVIEEIESAMKGLLDPEFKENVIGHAEVREVFKISRIGTIAGCMVTEGKISRNAQARLIRQGVVIYEGEIDSLKRFKDDAREVAQGYECGISLTNYNDIKESDIIEAFVMEPVER